MARSITSEAAFTLPDSAQVPFTVFDGQTGEYFQVARQDGVLCQSQYAVDRSGRESFRQTFKIAYAIGSGDSGIGFLIERGGYLFEAPLSYYVQSKLWSFSPGYELHNYAFRRPIVADCLSCHSGRPQPVYAMLGLYRDPPFLQLGVACENCHGPGELHVKERRAALPISNKFDTSIVNPARLSGWMSDNICMKCHQAGDVRVEQPDKHAEDFRPGAPLQNVIEIFKAAPTKQSAPGNPVLLEHYYSMVLSKCYRGSSGNLRCTTCHDPHVQQNRLEGAAFYRTRCLSCHTTRPCTLDTAERAKTNPPDDCAACHMPKRDVATIAHAALTEHRILMRPDEPLPDDVFNSGDPRSGLIRVTARPGDENGAVSDIVLLQAYAKLLHDGHEELRPRMDDVLVRLSHSNPDDSRVLSALARREAKKGTPEAFELATKYLAKAVRSGRSDPDDLLLLANLKSQASSHADAIELLKTGVRLNPYAPEFAEALSAEYVKLGDYANSLDVIRQGLVLFPDDKVLRKQMNQVQSATVDGLGTIQ
jgi:tetratricopeptide (TPR) repeat protein